MEVAILILSILAGIIGFAIPLLKKRLETRDVDHAALNQLGSSEFHAGVTNGVQQPPPPLQP